MSHNNSPNSTNELNLFSKHTTVYGHIDINNQNLQFNRYIDPSDYSPSLEIFTDDQSANGYLAPLPHQSNLEDSSDSDSTHLKQVNLSTNKAITKERPYEVPLSLRKPFRLPYKLNSTVITPQPKATLTTGSPLKAQNPTNDSEVTASHSPSITAKQATNDESTKSCNTEESSKPKAYEGTNVDNGNKTNTIPTRKSIISSHIFNNILEQPTHKVFTSSYLDKTFKPNIGSLKLPPELESLETLIMSQHEDLTQPIIDLGTINLNLTKILEKKKESTFNLQNDNKIPRSLRIKCELTSSPSYSQHPDFLKLKDALQLEVNNFITNGTKIMIDWAKINIKLLNSDRCSDILDKALQILDGLTFFYSNIFGTPHWQSVNEKHLTLFLFKLYISGMHFDVSSLLEYFDLQMEEILLIGTKVFLKTQSHETASKIISSLNLNDINMDEYEDNVFITEILLNFDQIIKLTTIGTWNHHQEKAKHTMAALKMKAKMKSLEVANASLSTAQAIAKASSALELNQIQNTNSNLRLAILEKSLQKQEQKSNEIINELKARQQQKSNSKNSKGSHITESVASPDHTTLSTKRSAKGISKRNMVDLTTEETEERELNPKTLHSPPTSKRSKQRQNPLKQGTRKMVHWKDKDAQHSLVQYPTKETSSNQMIQVQPVPSDYPQQTTPSFLQPPPPMQVPFPFHFYTYPSIMDTSRSHQLFPNSNFFQQHMQTTNPFNQPFNPHSKTTHTNNPFVSQPFHRKN